MSELTQKDSKTATLVLKKEHARIIHQLICERMDQIFLPFDRPGDVPSKEQRLILDAVCEYSAQLPYGCLRDD